MSISYRLIKRHEKYREKLDASSRVMAKEIAPKKNSYQN
jgi:hypothetical protein